MQSGAQFIVLLNSDATIVGEDAICLLDRLRDNPGLSILRPVLNEYHSHSVRSYIDGTDVARNSMTRRSADRKILSNVGGGSLINVLLEVSRR